MKLGDLSIPRKLLAILGLFAAAFVLAGGIVFWSWREVDRANWRVVHHCAPLMSACAEVVLDLAAARMELYRYLNDYEPSPYRVTEALAQARERLEWMVPQVERPDRKEKLLLLLALVRQYEELFGELPRARERGETFKVGELSNRLLELGTSAHRLAAALKLEMSDQVQADILSTSDLLSRYLWQAVVLAALCFTIGLGFIFLIGRDLRQGVDFLLAGFQSFSREHRKPFPVVARTDELGRAAVEINRMALELISREEALKDSEARYRAIVEGFDGLIHVCSPDYRIEFMNGKLIERTGRDATGEFCYQVLYEQDSPCSWCAKERVFQGETVRREVQSPGDNRWFYVVSTPIVHLDGRVSEQVMIQDVTERHEAEAALRRAKEEWEATFDAVSDLVAIIDREHRLVRVNRAMAARLGVEPRDLIGKTCHEVVHGTGAPPETCPLTHMFRDGREHCIEAKEPLLGGQFLVTASPLRDRHGNLVKGVHVAHDVTVLRQMEAERLRLDKLEALGVLAGGIAHDFNNILTAILGNLGLAELEADLSERVRARLLDAEKACERARALSNRLLAFAKGGAPIKKTLDLKTLLLEAAGLALSGSQACPAFTVAPDLHAVEADPGQLHQVISNLIINADQAMPQGGVVTVSAENVEIGENSGLPLDPGHYVKVRIVDQGVGIAPDYLDKIFDPYFTTKQKGSGLGLATAYAIAQRHGGHLAADSTPGAGSTFTLILPASGRELPTAPVVVSPLINGQGRRLLIMDDEGPVREVLGRMLVELGFEVAESSDGAEALALYGEALAEGRPFAAVILDLTVPGGLGGKETLAALLELDPQVRAIVSSGYADGPVMADYQRYGFRGVLAKPFQISELSSTLEEVLEP